MNNQPNIVISPPNNAGWREVLIGVHESFEMKTVLKDVEEYLIGDLSYRQNNDKRGWRWKQVHTDSHGMVFFTTNVRNNLEEE
jgi:hypothetical protein